MSRVLLIMVFFLLKDSLLFKVFHMQTGQKILMTGDQQVVTAYILEKILLVGLPKSKPLFPNLALKLSIGI